MTVTRMEAHDEAVEIAWGTLHKIMAWIDENDGVLVEKRDMLGALGMTEAEWDYTAEMVRPIGE